MTTRTFRFVRTQICDVEVLADSDDVKADETYARRRIAEDDGVRWKTVDQYMVLELKDTAQ